MIDRALVRRLESLLDRLEPLLPQTAAEIGAVLDSAVAYQWDAGARRLNPVEAARFDLADLRHLDEPVAALDENTARFVAGRPANNALLTGPRGCGKSSAVRGLLHKYAARGLRLIETDPGGLAHLTELRRLIARRRETARRPEKFIVYCDDLTFANAAQGGFRAIKTALDGALDGGGGVLVYATSNRRHLVPERMAENLESGEIHPAETAEEKIALSDRFGLWIPFFAPSPAEYLDIVRHWLARFGGAQTANPARLEEAALQFAAERGSRNGRIAYQFALAAAQNRRAKSTRK